MPTVIAPNGKLIQKHRLRRRHGQSQAHVERDRVTNRHVTLSVKAPPRSGPTTELMANTPLVTTTERQRQHDGVKIRKQGSGAHPNSPRSLGRCSRRVTSPMILSTATKSPAAPIPANARPKMRTSTLGEMAQMREPCSSRRECGSAAAPQRHKTEDEQSRICHR